MGWTDPKDAGLGGITGDSGGPDSPPGVFAGYGPVVDYERTMGSHAVLWKVSSLSIAVVTVRLEGSLDSSAWYPLASDLAISANGNTLAVFPQKPARYVRTATWINGTSSSQGSATVAAPVMAEDD